MSKIKSLQYLLLDTLNKRDKNLSKKLSNTIQVSESNENYLITWNEDSNLKKFEVAKSKFSFYQRNDITNNTKIIVNSLKTNNESAEYVVDEILKSKKLKNNSLNFVGKYICHIFIILISLTIILSETNISNKYIPILIIISFAFEVFDKRNIIFYVALFILSYLSLNEFIFFYCLFLLFFNLFEPIFFFKKTKIILVIFLILINFDFVNFAQMELDYNFLFINILTFSCILVNFTKYNSNFNWLYCIPSFSYGFFYNGELFESYLWICFCLFIHILFNYLDKIFFLKINTSPMLE